MKKHIRFFAVMLIFLMVFTLAGCGGTGGSGDSGDANEKLVALSEAFNGHGKTIPGIRRIHF